VNKVYLAVNNFVATSNQWKSWNTARILCINKSFKRNGIISTGMPNSAMWFKKWSNWTSSRSRTKKIGPDSTQKPPNPQPCREA